MRILCSTFLLVVTAFFNSGIAQGLEISWKRIGGFHNYALYEKRPFLDLTHISLERPFNNKQFSAGVDLLYSSYQPRLPEYYAKHLHESRFYDRSAAIGLFGRIYTDPAYFRLFLQGAVYANYLHIYQPIVIRHAYGVYTEIIDNKDFLASGAVALGFSLAFKNVSYEPYFQIGISEVPGEMRAEQAIVGSIGKLNNRIKGGKSYLIAPFCIKVKLD